MYFWNNPDVSTMDQCSMVKKVQGRMTVMPVMGHPPSSLTYLHSLAASGTWDNYEYQDDECRVTIHITLADKWREPGLEGVETITLGYSL